MIVRRPSQPALLVVRSVISRVTALRKPPNFQAIPQTFLHHWKIHRNPLRSNLRQDSRFSSYRLEPASD